MLILHDSSSSWEMGIKSYESGMISIRKRGVLEAQSKLCLSGNVTATGRNTLGTLDIECIELGLALPPPFAFRATRSVYDGPMSRW